MGQSDKNLSIVGRYKTKDKITIKRKGEKDATNAKAKMHIQSNARRPAKRRELL